MDRGFHVRHNSGQLLQGIDYSNEFVSTARFNLAGRLESARLTFKNDYGDI